LDKLYTLPETCRALRLSRSSVYRFIREGQLKVVHLGGRVVVTERELRRFIRRRS
jgi:excisionase family DNA binding protein